MALSAKILVVDDSEFIIELVESALTAIGCTVLKAYTGEDALELISRDIPDLIILDVVMPGLSGLEVCRRLKQNERTMLIPIVMLTSKDYVEDKITGFETGADEYLTKPFNIKELQVRVQALIRKKLSQVKIVEEEKQEALETMAEEVAHEVRNPVVAIGGFARRLNTKLPPASPLRTYVEKIIAEADRLEKMVNEIAAFRRLVVSMADDIDLRTVTDSVIDEMQDRIKHSGVRISRGYDSTVPMIKGDFDNLKIVVEHIFNNSLEAITGEGEIIVQIGTSGKTVFLSVQDNGRGMERGELQRITRPFYTSKMSGAGMGLVFVKTIVEALNGELDISSSVNAGTLVKLIFPVQE